MRTGTEGTVVPEAVFEDIQIGGKASNHEGTALSALRAGLRDAADVPEGFTEANHFLVVQDLSGHDLHGAWCVMDRSGNTRGRRGFVDGIPSIFDFLHNDFRHFHRLGYRLNLGVGVGRRWLLAQRSERQGRFRHGFQRHRSGLGHSIAKAGSSEHQRQGLLRRVTTADAAGAPSFSQVGWQQETIVGLIAECGDGGPQGLRWNIEVHRV